MCDPVTGVVTTMSIIGWTSVAVAASTINTQQNAADAQEQTNNTNAANMLTSRSQNANQINLGRGQANDAAGQKIAANNQAMREAQAATIARAGPSGLSVDAILSDMGRKGATYNQSVNENLDRTNMQLDNQLANVNSQTATGFNQMKTPAPVDYLGQGLRIGSAYTTYDAANPSTKMITEDSAGFVGPRNPNL